MVERREIRIDGLRLSYLEQGRAAKDPKAQPSLVLVHGLMGCADTFVPLMQALAPDLHVVALDLPGAGHSERRGDIDASLETTARIAGHALKALSLRKPVVLGHSHGGAVAMSLAARHRDALHSLVLLAPAHPYFDEGDPLIRFYLSLPGRMFAYTMPWFPAWLQMMGLRRMAGTRSVDTMERLRPYRDNLRTPGTMAHLLRLLRTWHRDMSGLRRALRKTLSTPSLIVWGDCDRAVPLHSAAELRVHLLHSELITLAGVGHRPAEETPELVAGFICEWLARDFVVASEAESIRYSPKASASQARRASLITPSLDAGD